MTREEMAKVMDEITVRMQEFREAGQREYAHREDNAFGNFERVGERLSLSREAVLLVYLEKHLDGIHSYVKGHRSQREDVEGRIIDAIVYLSLLYGMVVERRETERKEIGIARDVTRPPEKEQVRTTRPSVQEDMKAFLGFGHGGQMNFAYHDPYFWSHMKTVHQMTEDQLKDVRDEVLKQMRGGKIQ